MSLSLTLNCFTPCSSVSIVDFEQLNVSMNWIIKSEHKQNVNQKSFPGQWFHGSKSYKPGKRLWLKTVC